MIIFSFCFLIIFSVIIINHVRINLNELFTPDNIFAKEKILFIRDKMNYINFTKCKSIKELKEIRKNSYYRKKGYSGHPIKQIFSYPLDEKILIVPRLYKHNIDLVIFIHCRPDEFYERFLYRKTICKSNKYIVLYITSKSINDEVNNKIKIESYIYQDLLQFNEISSYFNLTIQTIHMVMWCNKNVKFKYMLKTDIDVYINIPLLLSKLKIFKLKNRYYAIGKISNTHVIRNKKYSHYVPRDIIKESMFPPYLQGVGYIIPYKTVKLISKTVEFVKPKIWIEDVFMGYLFKYNNISLIDFSKYILRETPENIINLTNNLNKYMLIHGFYPIEILLLYNKLNKQ